MTRLFSMKSLVFPLFLTLVPADSRPQASEPPHNEHSLDSSDFLSLAEAMKKIPPVYLRLVDKNHPLDSAYIPPRLVTLTPVPGLRPAREGLQLDSRAAAALRTMAAAAFEDGVTLIVSSAYRSFEYQASLFKRFTASHGEEEASRFSARAGTSQHQLGTVVDLGDITDAFAQTPAGKWMAANAGRFGWSLSYPKGAEHITGYKWESWHWRWIGSAAVSMQNQFFEGSQQRLLEFWAAKDLANPPRRYRNGTPENR